jgi:ABC-type thiamin/hydroxymethylpyrimidine transport system permease subunit
MKMGAVMALILAGVLVLWAFAFDVDTMNLTALDYVQMSGLGGVVWTRWIQKEGALLVTAFCAQIASVVMFSRSKKERS